MAKMSRCMLFVAVTAVLTTPAAAGELTVSMRDGLVTVIAKEVTVRQILAEWARVGSTQIVNADKMMGGPVTLELVDVPEQQALDILLRSAAGYFTASRPAAASGASQFDRVVILATSRAPVAPVSSAPQPFSRPAAAQPFPAPQPPPDDGDAEPGEQPAAPPGVVNPGMPFPGPTPAGNVPLGPDGMPVNQAPVTSPRPGQLPMPQPTPNQVNPYVPIVPTGRPLPQGGRGASPGPGGIQPDRP